MSIVAKNYSEELNEIEHELLEMATIAEVMVGQAVDALWSLNTDRAMAVVLRDDEIDRRDRSIESRCARLLAARRPEENDVRLIGTALKMITDIERVGDLAVDIAKITMKVDREFGEVGIIDLPRMASHARAMFRRAIQAYVRRDCDVAREVCSLDEEVDTEYRELRAQIFADMHAHPDMVVADSWLFLAIHHVERIADHAVNVAERVIYLVSGERQDYARLTN